MIASTARRAKRGLKDFPLFAASSSFVFGSFVFYLEGENLHPSILISCPFRLPISVSSSKFLNIVEIF